MCLSALTKLQATPFTVKAGLAETIVCVRYILCLSDNAEFIMLGYWRTSTIYGRTTYPQSFFILKQPLITIIFAG